MTRVSSVQSYQAVGRMNQQTDERFAVQLSLPREMVAIVVVVVVVVVVEMLSPFHRLCCVKEGDVVSSVTLRDY